MKPTTQTCNRCKVEKSLEAFSKCKSNRFGVNTICKACRNVKNPRKPMSFIASCTAAREAEARYAERNKHKRRAKDLVNTAVKTGKLIRPDQCSHCSKLTKVEGHHSDYSKPLDVSWLCNRCHNLEHVKFRV